MARLGWFLAQPIAPLNFVSFVVVQSSTFAFIRVIRGENSARILRVLAPCRLVDGFDEHGDVIGHPDVQHDDWLVYRVNTGNVEPMSPPVEPAVVAPSGFVDGRVVATNARGDQAGNLIDAWGQDDPRHDRGFIRSDGDMVVLDAAPGGASSHVTEINETGLVVGGPAAPMVRGRDPGRAFIFDPGTGTMTDLGTLPGYDNSAALAINAAGQVVGYS